MASVHVEGTPTYEEIIFEMRTVRSFRNQYNKDHHNGVNPFLK